MFNADQVEAYYQELLRKEREQWQHQMQDQITQSRRELELHYEGKIQGLEERSKCLDKSLDLLKEMKSKFGTFEAA